MHSMVTILVGAVNFFPSNPVRMTTRTFASPPSLSTTKWRVVGGLDCALAQSVVIWIGISGGGMPCKLTRPETLAALQSFELATRTRAERSMRIILFIGWLRINGRSKRCINSPSNRTNLDLPPAEAERSTPIQTAVGGVVGSSDFGVSSIFEASTLR